MKPFSSIGCVVSAGWGYHMTVTSVITLNLIWLVPQQILGIPIKQKPKWPKNINLVTMQLRKSGETFAFGITQLFTYMEYVPVRCKKVCGYLLDMNMPLKVLFEHIVQTNCLSIEEAHIGVRRCIIKNLRSIWNTLLCIAKLLARSGV